MIKIKGTRDYIDVSTEGKVVRIYGEMVLGGFIANADSFDTWLIPPEKPISENEKENLINQIKAKTKGTHMVITFEHNREEST